MSIGATKDECRRHKGQVKALQRTIECGSKREEAIEYTFRMI